MKRFLGAVGGTATAIGLFAAMPLVSAHHSTTMFDYAKALTIKGKVVEFRWVNPHVSLTIKGLVGDGKVEEEWVMEMTSPGNLVRAGAWSRTAAASPSMQSTLTAGRTAATCEDHSLRVTT